MTTVLLVENVSKSFGNFKALDGFSCHIPNGIIGLLGPNGAGKTTFIKSLLGLHPFESGSITLLDNSYSLPKDFLKVKDLIGYMPEKETKMNRLLSLLRKQEIIYCYHFFHLIDTLNFSESFHHVVLHV